MKIALWVEEFSDCGKQTNFPAYLPARFFWRELKRVEKRACFPTHQFLNTTPFSRAQKCYSARHFQSPTLGGRKKKRTSANEESWTTTTKTLLQRWNNILLKIGNLFLVHCPRKITNSSLSVAYPLYYEQRTSIRGQLQRLALPLLCASV